MSIGLVTERKLKRIFKVLKGTYFTLTGKGTPWEGKYWDEQFYTDVVGDAQTISAQKSELSAHHHYASVETLIFRDFFNHGINPAFENFLDIGSGAGHWIDFYSKMGAKQGEGIEVSEKCVEHLNEKYRERDDIDIHLGNVSQVLADMPSESFDLISSIGVLFHIVDDDELARCLEMIYQRLEPGGIFVAGGNFNHWPMNINTQVKDGKILNKRLRSKYWWYRKLRKVGFSKLRIHRNMAYAFIKDRTPENSILVCQK